MIEHEALEVLGELALEELHRLYGIAEADKDEELWLRRRSPKLVVEGRAIREPTCRHLLAPHDALTKG